MKKIMMLCIIIFVMSGCSQFDYNTMICKKNNDNYQYHLEYKKDIVKGFSIVKKSDLSHLSKDEFKRAVKSLEEMAEAKNTEDGIDETVQIDEKLATITTKVDFDKYNVKKDVLLIFQIGITKEDLKSASKMKEVLQKKYFTCDEIVDDKLN